MAVFGLCCLLIFIWAVLTLALLTWWHHLMTNRAREVREPRHRVPSE